MHPAEHAEPVVERHDHDIAGDRQPSPIDARLRAGTDDIAAAMDPDHHRPFALVAGRCPDVEVEAIFGLRLSWDADQVAHISAQLALHRRGGEFSCVADFVPRVERLRRTPAKLANRRLSEGHTAKNGAAVVLRALELAESGGDLRWHDRRLLLVIGDGSMVAGR